MLGTGESEDGVFAGMSDSIGHDLQARRWRGMTAMVRGSLWIPPRQWIRRRCHPVLWRVGLVPCDIGGEDRVVRSRPTTIARGPSQVSARTQQLDTEREGVRSVN